jgi:hypothetical protein
MVLSPAQIVAVECETVSDEVQQCAPARSCLRQMVAESPDYGVTGCRRVRQRKYMLRTKAKATNQQVTHDTQIFRRPWESMRGIRVARDADEHGISAMPIKRWKRCVHADDVHRIGDAHRTTLVAATASRQNGERTAYERNSETVRQQARLAPARWYPTAGSRGGPPRYTGAGGAVTHRRPAGPAPRATRQRASWSSPSQIRPSWQPASRRRPLQASRPPS